MRAFFQNPLHWLVIGVGVMILGMTAFVVFQPVTVVPRISYGPEYELVTQSDTPFSDDNLSGIISLYGFGYTSDHTDVLDQTIDHMKQFEQFVAEEESGVAFQVVMLMFDTAQDTPDRLQAFAQERSLEHWVLLSGDETSMKRTIGQGFGVYYEAVPLDDLLQQPLTVSTEPDAYGYLQSQRYFLVDGENFIRAEYRPPFDASIALRDIRLILREADSTGAARVANEAATYSYATHPKRSKRMSDQDSQVQEDEEVFEPRATIILTVIYIVIFAGAWGSIYFLDLLGRR